MIKSTRSKRRKVKNELNILQEISVCRTLNEEDTQEDSYVLRQHEMETTVLNSSFSSIDSLNLIPQNMPINSNMLEILPPCISNNTFSTPLSDNPSDNINSIKDFLKHWSVQFNMSVKGWNIVSFTDDDSIEAVPDIWVKKKSCAWPKNGKHAKKLIEKRTIPNTNEFNFYKARVLGNKTYNSLNDARSKLPTALYKSDLSSADDIVVNHRKKYKHNSLSPDLINNKKQNGTVFEPNSCPPRYTDVLKNLKNSTEQKKLVDDGDDEDSFDDTDTDPTWCDKRKLDDLEHNNSDIEHEEPSFKKKVNFDIDENEYKNDDEDKILMTPTKINNIKESLLQSPSGSWIVTNSKTSIDLQSPSGSWKVTNIKTPVGLKRNLFPDKINKSGHKVEDITMKKSEPNTNIEPKFATSTDFQSLVLSSLTYLKHGMNNLMYTAHSNYENIVKLMNDKSSSISSFNDEIDMDSLFPITNDNELRVLENKIKDPEFRRVLVHRISLLIGNKDLGNSVRRIMMRLFSDQFLVNYSLYGFKKKISFANLPCYRLIIDSLRVHGKYKTSTEKEIDTPLAIWLSHAPFREKKKKEDN
ncbi:hypothetical protein ACI65C_013239 [Semiaphis heraclei]